MLEFIRDRHADVWACTVHACVLVASVDLSYADYTITYRAGPCSAPWPRRDRYCPHSADTLNDGMHLIKVEFAHLHA